jgi:threonylcarbamoyladenosine tRNA methylthiotransferase MtaB
MGCRSNFADSVELTAALVKQGGVPCDFNSAADVYVLNTCTVTDSAEKEVRGLIARVRRQNPGARVVITGCLATVGSPVFGELSQGDSVVPPGERKQLLDRIFDGALPDAKPQTSTVIPRRSQRLSSKDIDLPLPETTEGPTGRLGELSMRKRFHLRVQEGCDNFCTFCIIPYTRGKVVSRSRERILEDLHKLHELGYQEVVLTGTHLGGWGTDLGSSLHELLQEMAKSSPVKRVRLSSLDPDDVTTEMIDLIAGEEIFCEHLHLCLQALDESILKRMNRRYTLQEAIKLLEYTRKRIPVAALGTDLITGFPGESDTMFDGQCELLEQLPLSYVHVFPYSERTGTAATRLPDEVELSERRRRGTRLRAIAGRKFREFARGFVGSDVEVVLEDGDKGVVRGTTREFVEARIMDLAGLGEGSLQPGRCVQAKVKTFSEKDEALLCELLSPGN